MSSFSSNIAEMSFIQSSWISTSLVTCLAWAPAHPELEGYFERPQSSHRQVLYNTWLVALETHMSHDRRPQSNYQSDRPTRCVGHECWRDCI